MFQGRIRTAFVLMIAAVAVTGSSGLEAQPVALAVDDADLEWGPCPPFMPEGCEIAVLHGNPAERNADILFRVPGGSEIPAHWHTSAERMILLTGSMTVEYDGHAPVALDAGSYAYGPPRLSHTASCEPGDPCTLFIAFEEPVDAHATE